MARPGRAAHLLLDLLADVEQLQRAEGRRDAHDRVQEIALVEHLAHGLGLVDGGAGLDLHGFTLRQALYGVAQLCKPVTHVRAQPEPGLPGLRQRLTSTETSSTGSGMGGSGLVARTTIPLAPKRSSSMSATAVQTRSSVR